MNNPHTTSQSSCKELHTLLEARGEVMETEYWWWEDKESKVNCLNHGMPIATEEWYEIYPAPLATEILERLPTYVDDDGMDAQLVMQKGQKNWYVMYGTYGMECEFVGFVAPTLAQAVTDMLIHLIKSELTSPTSKKINQSKKP